MSHKPCEQDDGHKAVGRGYRFGRERGLKKPREFSRVFRGRCSVADARLVVYGCVRPAGPSRLGVSVGRRHGSAVVRNRYKRTIREAFRLIQHELPCPSCDYVVIPRQTADASTRAYIKSLRQLTRRLHKRQQRKAASDRR